MSDNGWPGEPGVPLNPERDGPHWLGDPDSDRAFVVDWSAAIGWLSIFTQDSIAAYMRYIAPCLTPAEVEARVKEAQRDAQEEAARRLEELHKNHKYNPKTGEGSEHDVGYYRALSEGAAWIRALSDAPSGMVLVPRDQQAETRAAKILAERNQLIGILQLAVEQNGDKEKEPAWFVAACRILNAGFTKAVGKGGEGNE
jgi:hypothetical protein